MLIGYNVLGSYARARQRAGAPIGIVLPRDYTLLMSRVVAIPKAARQPVLAKLFVDHLLSARGQAVIAATAGLEPLLQRRTTRPDALDAAAGSCRPGAADHAWARRCWSSSTGMKRERFLADWSAAVRRP